MAMVFFKYQKFMYTTRGTATVDSDNLFTSKQQQQLETMATVKSMSSMFSVKGTYGLRFSAAKCKSKARIDGKTVVITGGNTGIGKETAIDLAKRGGRVVICCRNAEKAEKALTDIKASSGSENVDVYSLDLSSFQSIRDCASQILEKEPQIDILINNAGIMGVPYSKTADGFENHMGTNHLGHFLFTILLLPKIKKSENARIVNVSALLYQVGHIYFEDFNLENTPYDGIKAYGNSKLANILFTRELAKILEKSNVNNIRVYSLHPGVIGTELSRHMKANFFIKYTFPIAARFIMKTLSQGAQTTIHCAVSEDAANENGLYYEECKPKDLIGEALDDDVAKRLWELSLKSVGFSEDYDILSDH